MKHLYIDESGVFSRDKSRIDPQNPIFLIAGVIIDPKEINRLFREFNKLKLKYFQDNNIVFHASEFANPGKSKQTGIQQLESKEFRKRFFFDLNKLIDDLDFKLCGFTIHVEEYLKALEENQPDPYIIGTEIILDTFVNNLNENEQGKIIVESRSSSKLNNEVLQRWREHLEKHKRVGVIKSADLDIHKIQEPVFIPKSPKSPGLELVDLVAYQFARMLARRKAKGIENEIMGEIINKKIVKYYSLPAHPHYYLK